MSNAPRLVASDPRDDDADATLRPQRLTEFIGQEQARANLNVFIEAARARKEALDHGIASLFARGDAARRKLPMSPEDLLEAAVLIYLRGLGLNASARRR